MKSAQTFESTIILKTQQKIADARSILAIMLLCATMGTMIEIEVNGTDEEQAITAVASIFEIEN